MTGVSNYADENKRMSKIFELSSDFRGISGEEHANVILVYGPTGAGKSYTVNSVLNKLGIPHWTADMKQFSEVGYQGREITDIFSDFWINQGYSTDAINNGVIVLDEFDKIKSIESANQKDVSGIGIQQSLLKIFDGVKQMVSSNGVSRSHPNDYVETQRITYVLIGAFDYWKDFYNLEEPQWRSLMKSSGFLSELVDRISFIEYVKEPTKSDLIGALTDKSSGLLNLGNQMFDSLGVDVKFPITNEFAERVINSIKNEEVLYSYRTVESKIKNTILDVMLLIDENKTDIQINELI